MNIALSSRIAQVKPSATLSIAAEAARRKAQGQDIISLSTGEPDFDTPRYIKDAAIAAIQSGFTKYTAVDGIMELKQAVQNKFLRENNLNFALNEIMISCGAKQAIYNLFQALLEAGDEVLIPGPFWVSYPDMALLADAVPVCMPTLPAMHYKITPEILEAAITPKTKLLILNSPSNPTGTAYSRQELEGLAAVLLRHPHVFIATDDIYEHIIWSAAFVNIVNACPALAARTIVFNGVSKAYAMTGWRIGYAAGPAHVIQAMSMIQSQSTSNPCSIAQKAAVAALNGGDFSVKEMVATFKARYDFVSAMLTAIPDLALVPADGTFYCFPDMQAIIARKGFRDDVVFCQKLLEEQQLAVVPGTAFGQKGCIRISFATDDATLSQAMNRLSDFCA